MCGYHNITLNWVALKLRGFPGATVVKNLRANAGDTGDAGLILGSGRSPGVGNGNLPQYSCLENSTERNLAGYSPWGYIESDTRGDVKETIK